MRLVAGCVCVGCVCLCGCMQVLPKRELEELQSDNLSLLCFYCRFSPRLPEPRADPVNPRDFDDNDSGPSMDHAPWYRQTRPLLHPPVLQCLLQAAVSPVELSAWPSPSLSLSVSHLPFYPRSPSSPEPAGSELTLKRACCDKYGWPRLFCSQTFLIPH